MQVKSIFNNKLKKLPFFITETKLPFVFVKFSDVNLTWKRTFTVSRIFRGVHFMDVSTRNYLKNTTTWITSIHPLVAWLIPTISQVLINLLNLFKHTIGDGAVYIRGLFIIFFYWCVLDWWWTYLRTHWMKFNSILINVHFFYLHELPKI